MFLKKRLWPRYFPVNLRKFLRTPFLTEHLRWLLLELMRANNSNETLFFDVYFAK